MFRRGWTTKAERGPRAGEASGHGGLGLALVEQAARRHGGSVDVGCEVGAVFAVRLPLERTPEGVRR